MIVLIVQMGIVMRNVKMYCICDDENMTKCFCFDRKYFTNNLQSSYLKCLSLFCFEQGQGLTSTTNFKFCHLGSLRLLRITLSAFLLEQIPMLFQVLLMQDRKYLLIILRIPITVPINVTSRQHLLEYIC